ncbi:MAG TPA: TonB-dependent receptor [Edaphobacter sp.]
MRSLRFAALHLLALSIALLPVRLPAQRATATVNGTITDPSGNVIPDVAVVITSQDTGVARHTTTNNSGYFTFLDLTPGPYTLNISKQGFKTVELPSFNLVVNQVITVNQTMEVGAVNETIRVTATQEMLQNSTSELGNVIQTSEIQQLPLNGRNFTSLLILSPGVNPVSTAQGSGISTTDAGITAIPGTAYYKVSFFGQQNRQTFYYMDGIVNTDVRGAVYGFLPIIDTMEQFKVQSHIDSAEFGVVTGGVVNMLSKSGTNSIHGSAWEFVRNNIFDARNSFSDFCTTVRCGPNSSTNTPASPLHYTQNQFGGSIGGPILRQRLFFYGGYEGWRFSKPGLSQTVVPTPQEISGDFSSPTYSYYQNKIYNPYSTVCSGGKCTVQQFLCNSAGTPITPVNNVQTGGTPCLKIPSSMLNQTMVSYIKAYYLPPNSIGNEPSGFNYVESRPQVDNSNAYQVRVDFHKSEKNFGFGRVSQMWVHDTQPNVGTINTNVSNYHAYNFGGGFTHVFTPNLLLDVRGGAMLKPYVFNQAYSSVGYGPASDAGFQNPGQYGGMYTNLATPYPTSNAGSQGDSARGNPVVNAGGSISYVRGRHNMKAGMDYIYQNRLQQNLFQQYNFSDSQTSNINAAKTGNSLASALLGFPSQFQAQTPELAEVYFKMTLWSFYAQDSWKAKPNLTLNFGMRYEYVPGIGMLDSRLANNLDIPHQTYTISASSVPACTSTFTNPCIPGGISSIPFNNHIVFSPGQKVGPPISDNIAPRFGFAYQRGNNTVVNGGLGMFYDSITARSQWVQNNIEGPTWPWNIGISAQQVNTLQGGIWPGAPQNPLVPITSLEGNSTPQVAANPWLTTGGGYVSSPDYKNQRAVLWNLQVQEQLSQTTLFSLGYAGSRSTRLNFTGYANAASQPSPAGTPPATVDTYRYMPWASSGWHYSIPTGYANYHALLAQFQKRFSNSRNTIASYTWSKTMDNSSGWFNAENGTGGASVVQSFFLPRNAYGVASYDIRHYFSWSTVYSLPFGRGQRWLQTGIASYLLGGIKTNFLFQARTGQPYNLTVGGDPANISGGIGSVTGYSRPNINGDPTQGSCGSTPVGKRGTTGFCNFNPLVFSIPSGSYGNMGKMVLRQIPFNNLDFSVVKQTPLHENINLELRAESFNTYNVVIPAAPGTTIGNNSAGLATTQGSTPRELQFGAKIIF